MSEKKEERKLQVVTRRGFIKSGGLAVGALAVGSGLALTGCTAQQPAAAPPPEPTPPPDAPAWPWPYEKLDPELARKIGHEGFYEARCCYGAFKAIVTQLNDKIGYPYNTIPLDMMRFGVTGVGWAGTCGAILGAAAAINLVVEKFGDLTDELQAWYIQYPFPSETSNKLAVEKAFKTDKGFGEIVSNASGSPLCHVSVTNWSKASGLKANSPERSERCARLTGDVAAFTVEMLNALHDGKFEKVHKAAASVKACMECHGQDGRDDTRGKDDCILCHGDPHA
ncbi:MAG: C-GCAxxG-C-C family (seleno)protein [Bacillota bacterium]